MIYITIIIIVVGIIITIIITVIVIIMCTHTAEDTWFFSALYCSDDVLRRSEVKFMLENRIPTLKCPVEVAFPGNGKKKLVQKNA